MNVVRFMIVINVRIRCEFPPGQKTQAETSKLARKMEAPNRSEARIIGSESDHAGSSKPAAKSSRLQFLDFLRMIAACLVVLQHSAHTEHESFFSNVLNPGRVGVYVFFVISGFVIPISIEKTVRVSDFLITRFFRLYPAYWFSLLWHFVAWRNGAQLIQLADFNNPWHWIANLSMLQMYVGVKDISLVAWTLGLEWIIYAAAMLGIVKGVRANHTAFYWVSLCSFFLLSVVLPFVIHKRVPGGLFGCLIAALAGFAIYSWYRTRLSTRSLFVQIALNVVVQLLNGVVNYGYFHKDLEFMSLGLLSDKHAKRLRLICNRFSVPKFHISGSVSLDRND